MPLFYLSLAFIAGLASAPFLPLAALGMGVALAALAALKGWGRHLLLPALCLAAFGAGALRGELAAQSAAGQALRAYNDSGPVEVVGMVAGDPEPLGRTTRLRLEVRSVRAVGQPGSAPQPADGLALISAPPYPDLGPGRDFPYYRYGDLLRLRGELRAPPQLPDFDYREYLARQGVYSLMSFPQKVELAAQSQGLAPLEWLYGLRQRLAAGLARSLPEPQASLAQAMLLGQRGQLPDDLRDAFALSGTSHLVAISGQNLTILLGLLVAAAVWVWGRHRPHYFVLGLAAIWGYSLLTGLAPPVVRASLMGSLWLLAGFLGRPGSAGTALALSAAAMAGLSPELLQDVSFQLSFAAMAGLVFLAPLLVGWGQRLWARQGGEVSRPLLWAWDIAAITVSATLLTLPIVAVNFPQVSLVGLPATLLAAPTLPGIMVLGGLSALGSALWLPLGQGLAWLAWPFLTWLMAVAQGFAALPQAALKVDGVGPAWAWGYYGLLAGLVALARGRAWLRASATGLLAGLVTLARPAVRDWLRASATRLLAGLVTLARPAVRDWLRASATRLLSGASALGGARLTGLLAALLLANVLAWGAFFTLPPASLQVYFLDVGQGDAVLIRTPQNRKILIDGGPSIVYPTPTLTPTSTPQNHKVPVDGGPKPAALSAQLGQRLPFWDRTIDLVVLTHPDSDHLSGLVETLRRYQVKAAWEGGRAQDDSPSAVDAKTGPVYREWRALLTEKSVSRQRAEAGMRLELEPGLWLEVLHPPGALADSAFAEEDNYGAVLRLTAGEVSFLFAADLRVEGELYLLAQGSLKSTVLKVAHHGSATSTSPEWLEAVAPQVAVVSVGADNPFGHPNPGVLGRLQERLGAEKVYLTSKRGTVTATVANGRLSVATEK